MFIILNWFSSILDSILKLRTIFYSRKTYRSYKIWTLLNLKKRYNIFHIIDQIKVSRVLVLIGHCHRCIECTWLRWYIYSLYIYIDCRYIYTNVISVCVFVCLSDHNSEPLHRFASIFDWGIRENHTALFLALFWDSNFSGSTFIGKKSKM